MSLLTPIKVPVKVYKWDDVGAPRLDKTAGCMMTIFKACLVTGYGTKESAGWTMPFGDTSTGVKVFRPPVTVDTDFYLRCSADTGEEMTAQVYLDMTDANTGGMKFQCDTPFKYGFSGISTKWIVIACSNGFWFFTEGSAARLPVELRGIFFYCCNAMPVSATNVPIVLHHTGGSWGIADTDRYPINHVSGGGGYVPAKVLLETIVYSVVPSSFFSGSGISSSEIAVTQFSLNVNSKIFLLPAYGSSRNDSHNRTVVQDHLGRNLISHSTGLNGNNNIYIPTDYWVI